MPKKKYPLRPVGPKRLEVSWRWMWKDLTIRLDGNQIGSIATQKELKAGREFSLEGGLTLKVQLARQLSPELHLLIDGRPVSGSASDPAQLLRVASGIVFFIAGLNIVLGFAAELFQVDLLLALGVGVGSIFFGVIFLPLGFFIKRRSMLALAAAIGLFVLDGLLSMVLAVEQGGRVPTGGIVARVILMIPMVRGFGAIRALKRGN